MDARGAEGEGAEQCERRRRRLASTAPRRRLTPTARRLTPTARRLTPTARRLTSIARRRLEPPSAVGALRAVGALGEAEVSDRQRWQRMWSERFECWWLVTPHQEALRGCFGALGLHLAHRFEQTTRALRAGATAGAPAGATAGATAGAPGAGAQLGTAESVSTAGCEWVDAQSELLQLPAFPELPQSEVERFKLPIAPIPRLLPPLEHLMSILPKREDRAFVPRAGENAQKRPSASLPTAGQRRDEISAGEISAGEISAGEIRAGEISATPPRIDREPSAEAVGTTELVAGAAGAVVVLGALMLVRALVRRSAGKPCTRVAFRSTPK